MFQGKFAGMCGSEPFHVCCQLRDDPGDYLKGPPPPLEYLVQAKISALDLQNGTEGPKVMDASTTEGPKVIEASPTTITQGKMIA